MKLSFKDKTYGLCRSCENCEFYDIYLNWVWCKFPFNEIHWFGKNKIRPIKQDEIFTL